MSSKLALLFLNLFSWDSFCSGWSALSLRTSTSTSVAPPNRSVSDSKVSLAYLAPSSILNVNSMPLYETKAFSGDESLAKLQDNIEKDSVLAARLVGWIVSKIISSNARSISGLSVRVLSTSNRDVLRGRIGSIYVKVDSIACGVIQTNGGAMVLLDGVELKLRQLFFGTQNFLRKPYRINTDFVLTQSDIVNSRWIKGLIQNLVNWIVSNKIIIGELIAPTIKMVTIRSRRIFVLVDVVFPTGAIIPVEISTGVGVRNNRQIIFLRDLTYTLDPNGPLNPFRRPLLIQDPIDVDLGEDCFIEGIDISNKSISVRAMAIISPVNPFTVAPVANRAACRFDLAALLSSVLRVNGGVARIPGRWLLRKLGLRKNA